MRVLLALVVVLLLALGAFAALAWRSEIDAIEPPDPSSFDEEQVEQGARLAALGNCVDCHTAPGGPTFAGGYAMNTPYGVIYGTNITPDPETGIGTWSEEAFIRAMREGVDREGGHLYPAFPYDQFTRASDEDLEALYAFLMTRRPVRNEAPEPEVAFPFGFRPLLAGWKLLFHDEERFTPVAEQSDEWNHGAYLVEGLAHCGACHTPRNQFGAREEERALAGGESEEWYAPPLNEDSTAPVPWSRESLAQYLRSGAAPHQATAAGPMAPVVRNLSQVPPEDVDAIAIYIADRMGAAEAAEAPPSPLAEPAVAPGEAEGVEAIFAGACATCHEASGPLHFSATVPLAQATSIEHADPRNLIHVILEGVEQPLAPGQPLMPGFATAFSDQQVAELAAYLRERFSERPAWEGLEQEVARIRDAQNRTQSHQGAAAGQPVEEADE